MPRNQDRGQPRPHEQQYQGWQSQEREERGRFDEERGRLERHDGGRGYHSYSRDDEGDDNARYQQWLRSHERGQGADRSWNQSWHQDRSQPYGPEDRDWRRQQYGRGEDRDWQRSRGRGQEYGQRDDSSTSGADRDWRGRYLGDDERERRFRDDRGDDRGFFERAGERIRSWFSDDDDDDRDRERRYGASRDFGSADRDYGRSDYDEQRFGGYQDRMREDPRVRGGSRGMDERRSGPGRMMGMRGGQDRDERGRFIGDDDGYRGFGDDRQRGEIRRWGQGEHAPDRDEQRGGNVDPYDDRGPSRGGSWNRGRRY